MRSHQRFRQNDSTVRNLSPFVLLLGTALALVVLAIQPGADAASGTTAGIGVIRWGTSYPTGSGYDRYSYVSVGPADAAKAGALPTTSLVYTSGTSVKPTWSTGVTYDEALANGWLLKDSSGQYIKNVAYGAYVGDIGNAAYQQRFIDNMSVRLPQNGNEGIFLDDVISTPALLTGGAWPAKYPTQDAWEDAMVSFVAKVGGTLRARGYYVLAHANGWLPGDANSDNGVNNALFWGRLAPHVSGLESEYWVQDPTNEARLRASGAAWYQQWDGHVNFATVAQNGGADFFALMYGSTSSLETMRYGKASFLLMWDGSGGAFVFEADGDPWNAEWTMDIGQPSGARYQVGVGWRREYTSGTALVNPSPTASQTFALGGTYTRADGTAVTSVTLAPTTGLVLRKQSSSTPPPANTSLPAITGTAQQGQSLSASTGTWSNSPTAYAYQWKRCDSAGANCASIAGGTAARYVLGSSDVGKRLRVTVTASNGAGSGSATSNPTELVAPEPATDPKLRAPKVVERPVISGAAEEGRVLSASRGTWSNSPTSYWYQWRRCNAGGGGCVSIPGANDLRYSVGAADVGQTLRIVVAAVNEAGDAWARSDPTGIIGPEPASLDVPRVVTRPATTGTASVGRVLSASRGTWSNSPAWYWYQWRRCDSSGANCVNIVGANALQYTIGSADLGKTLRIVVAAINAAGVTWARSDVTRAVTESVSEARDR
jgi:hypothetical protein